MKANEYEASKHQRQVVNRFNNFIQEGDDNFDKDIAARQQERKTAEKGESEETKPETGLEQSTVTTEAAGPAALCSAKKQKPRKAPKNVAANLRTRIRSSEYLHSPDITSWKHRLRVCFCHSIIYSRDSFQI
jgi:hypothetical protein